jgi:hypothetical protein
MTTAEVEDFGFADSPALYGHIRSPGAATNGHAPRADIDDDDHGFFSTGLGDAPLDMFKVERAQLNLNITILQLVVSNNILVMASTDSKIYKIDLTLQEQIVGMLSKSTDEKWNCRRNMERTRRLQRYSLIIMEIIYWSTQKLARHFISVCAIREGEAGLCQDYITCTSNPLLGVATPRHQPRKKY